jgi:hypothetical protein
MITCQNRKKFGHFQISHSSLKLKPFVLIAGLSDNEDALDFVMRTGYSDSSQYLFINHATGHRPPMEVLEKGYDFLQKCF